MIYYSKRIHLKFNKSFYKIILLSNKDAYSALKKTKRIKQMRKEFESVVDCFLSTTN